MIFGISFLLIISCRSAIWINQDSIRYEWPKTNTFELSLIEPLSLTKKGKPVKYEYLEVFRCELNNGQKALKEISFIEEIENYNWCKVPCSKNDNNEIPKKLEYNKYYEIKGYLDGWEFEDTLNVLIFKIKENGKAKKYY